MARHGRAIFAILLSQFLVGLLGWFLELSLVRVAFILFVSLLFEAGVAIYAASKGTEEISGSRSLALFGLYLKRVGYYLLIFFVLALSLIWNSSAPTYNAFFSCQLLVLILLIIYILSSYGIEPAQKAESPWKSSK